MLSNKKRVYTHNNNNNNNMISFLLISFLALLVKGFEKSFMFRQQNLIGVKSTSSDKYIESANNFLGPGFDPKKVYEFAIDLYDRDVEYNKMNAEIKIKSEIQKVEFEKVLEIQKIESEKVLAIQIVEAEKLLALKQAESEKIFALKQAEASKHQVENYYLKKISVMSQR